MRRAIVLVVVLASGRALAADEKGAGAPPPSEARPDGERPAGPEAARTYAVAPGSVLSYRIVHPFHAVDGVSKAIEGRARILEGGAVQAMVRARVDSFDSGNGNRDAQMRAATEAAKYPFVTLKAAGTLPPIESYPAALDLILDGELTFHGQSRPLKVPVKVRFESPARAKVEGGFPVSLDAFQVERPALLFVKVEDRLDVRANLVLEAER